MENSRPIYRKTCKRWDTPFDAHYLTFSCFQRQPFFRSERACRWFLESLGRARDSLSFDLWAFVIMPEHAHLILWPHGSAGISSILKAIKLPVAKRVVAFVRKNHPSFLARMEDRQPSGQVVHRFWQRGGGYDRNLRSARDVHEKIHYVHENPVRRKMVEKPEDWPWTSYRAHYVSTDEPIHIDRDSIPVLLA